MDIYLETDWVSTYWAFLVEEEGDLEVGNKQDLGDCWRFERDEFSLFI